MQKVCILTSIPKPLKFLWNQNNFMTICLGIVYVDVDGCPQSISISFVFLFSCFKCFEGFLDWKGSQTTLNSYKLC